MSPQDHIDNALPPGKLFDVGVNRYHVLCNKPPGLNNPCRNTPTIIIEGGRGCALPIYARLQKALSETASVICYDRAGLGWSTPSKKPRDAKNISTELNALLRVVTKHYGFSPPFFFVGHSIASLYLCVYASRYPKHISGIILLDASHPHQYDRGYFADEILDYFKSSSAKNSISLVDRLAIKLGLSKRIRAKKIQQRKQSLARGPISLLPESAKQQLLQIACNPDTYLTPYREKLQFNQSAQQALSAGGLNDIPLLVLSAVNLDTLPESIDKREYKTTWLILQRELADLSSAGQQRVIAGACHNSIVTSPVYANKVSEEILLFIRSLSVSSSGEVNTQ